MGATASLSFSETALSAAMRFVIGASMGSVLGPGNRQKWREHIAYIEGEVTWPAGHGSVWRRASRRCDSDVLRKIDARLRKQILDLKQGFDSIVATCGKSEDCTARGRQEENTHDAARVS